MLTFISLSLLETTSVYWNRWPVNVPENLGDWVDRRLRASVDELIRDPGKSFDDPNDKVFWLFTHGKERISPHPTALLVDEPETHSWTLMFVTILHRRE